MFFFSVPKVCELCGASHVGRCFVLSYNLGEKALTSGTAHDSLKAFATILPPMKTLTLVCSALQQTHRVRLSFPLSSFDQFYAAVSQRNFICWKGSIFVLKQKHKI